MSKTKNQSKGTLYTATYRFEGKRYYVRSAISQRDADKRAAKALHEREAGTAVIGENIRVADYALRWVETYKSTTVSETVYKSYLARIKNHIIPQIGALRMRDVRATNLQGVMNKQAGKSKTHCDKLLFTLRAIFHQALRDGIIRRDPAEDITAPKAVDGTHRSLTDNERAGLLLVASTHRFGLAVKLMLYCGLRPQEAAALRWCDIDQVNRRLLIRRALKKDGAIGTPKSAAGQRDVPIPPALWESLIIPPDLNRYILLTTHGERYSHTALKRAWDSFKRAMDIQMGATLRLNADGSPALYYGHPVIAQSVLAPDLNMYCLRHTYCTDLEAAGVSINVAKYLMGHSSITLTAKIYTHMREDTLAAAAEKIAQTGATTGATDTGEKGGKTQKNAASAALQIRAK